MEGLLVEIKSDKPYDIVDTRNDQYGRLRIYYPQSKPCLKTNTSVHFKVKKSSSGYTYAVYVSVVERNQVPFNTEDRSKWYEWGEDAEADFIQHIVPQIGLNIQKNPEKVHCSWAIDLYDYTNNKPADLKTQNMPFFTVSQYKYKGSTCDPAYSVTFNHKDYKHYKNTYPNCDIYFWVHWKQLSYREITVSEVYGVWRGAFSKMAMCIETKQAPLHRYIHRKDDDHNAKESYIFNLLDTEVFTRVI